MELEKIQAVLHKWAASNSYIKRLWIYGSRARSDFTEVSDLDVAVEILPSKDDDHPMAVFAFDSPSWIAELQPQLPYRLHLKGYYGEESPDVQAGLRSSSILVYENDT